MLCNFFCACVLYLLRLLAYILHFKHMDKFSEEPTRRVNKEVGLPDRVKRVVYLLYALLT